MNIAYAPFLLRLGRRPVKAYAEANAWPRVRLSIRSPQFETAHPNERLLSDEPPGHRDINHQPCTLADVVYLCDTTRRWHLSRLFDSVCTLPSCLMDLPTTIYALAFLAALLLQSGSDVRERSLKIAKLTTRPSRGVFMTVGLEDPI